MSAHRVTAGHPDRCETGRPRSPSRHLWSVRVGSNSAPTRTRNGTVRRCWTGPKPTAVRAVSGHRTAWRTRHHVHRWRVGWGRFPARN